VIATKLFFVFARSADCWHFTWEEYSGSFLFDQLMIMCYAILDDDKMKTEASPLFRVLRKHQISLVLPLMLASQVFHFRFNFFQMRRSIKVLVIRKKK